MSNRLVLAALLVMSAAPLAAQKRRTVIVSPGHTVQIISDTMGASFVIPFPYARVYRALVATYGQLKITASEHDSASGQVGNLQFITHSPLAGKAISEFLSCGSGATGPYADSDRIYLSIMSYLTPDGPDRTKLNTGLLGTAVNVAEGAREPMACATTGRLEIRLYDLLVKLAAAP